MLVSHSVTWILKEAIRGHKKFTSIWLAGGENHYCLPWWVSVIRNLRGEMQLLLCF